MKNIPGIGPFTAESIHSWRTINEVLADYKSQARTH